MATDRSVADFDEAAHTAQARVTVLHHPRRHRGRERLRLIARIMRPTTLALFERVGVRDGATCLDAGCGGGDVSFELARLIGARGRVVGIDLDAVKLEVARAEAAAAAVANVEFRQGDTPAQAAPPTGFGVVYARFLLTHLCEPAP